MKNNTRESNIELLRIILMIMIISIHYFMHGGALVTLNPGDNNYYTTNFIYSFIIIAVNCFIIISGYFGIKAKIKKIIEFELQGLFYSTLIFGIFVLSGIEKINIESIKNAFLPTLSFTWWFFTTYLVLYILSPYLNIIIDSLSKEKFINLLIITSVFFVLAPTFRLNPTNNNGGFSLYNFIYLYFLGSYLRKFYTINKTKYTYLSLYIIFSICTFIYCLILEGDKNFYEYKYDSVLLVLSSVCLFLFFKSIKIKCHFINKLSTYMFGVYLLHDHPYVRKYIYVNIFNTNKYYGSNVLFINAAKTIICIFIVGTIIEFIRQIVFSKFEDIISNRIYKLKANLNINSLI